MPTIILNLILSYINQKELYKFRIISKLFSKEANCLIKNLNLKKHNEIPQEILFSLLCIYSAFFINFHEFYIKEKLLKLQRFSLAELEILR